MSRWEIIIGQVWIRDYQQTTNPCNRQTRYPARGDVGPAWVVEHHMPKHDPCQLSRATQETDPE